MGFAPETGNQTVRRLEGEKRDYSNTAAMRVLRNLEVEESTISNQGDVYSNVYIGMTHLSNPTMLKYLIVGFSEDFMIVAVPDGKGGLGGRGRIPVDSLAFSRPDLWKVEKISQEMFFSKD